MLLKIKYNIPHTNKSIHQYMYVRYPVIQLLIEPHHSAFHTFLTLQCALQVSALWTCLKSPERICAVYFDLLPLLGWDSVSCLLAESEGKINIYIRSRALKL